MLFICEVNRIRGMMPAAPETSLAAFPYDARDGVVGNRIGQKSMMLALPDALVADSRGAPTVERSS